jgi:hypothetical protein
VPAVHGADPATTPIPNAKHWAFEPIHAVDAPADPTGWSTGAIDRFVAAKRRQHSLEPVGQADRRTLIRRATFDLIGLPPTPEEVEFFRNDDRPDAYERLVDRLLASPHYGERWGRHWLDIVRYADTAGETADYPVPDAWRYRNWVIEAFNRDQPYDEFIREQIAGDILAARIPKDQLAADPSVRRHHDDLIVATGFIAISRRFGFNITADRHLTIEDTIDTLGKSVLGLALGCARCHDHKFDPISSKDYYALYGIFDSTRYPFPGCEHTKVPRDMVPLQPMNPQDDGKAKASLAYAVAEGEVHNVKLQMRGEPENAGEEVARRNLQLLGGQPVPPDGGSGRLALAGWLTQPDNPLTARVMVNRIWQHHFGTGIVKTPNDFGSRGVAPTHPELLDWLAERFIREGWSVKAMHRMIMLSATYRLAPNGQEVSADPENVWLWKSGRRRLGAEEIRDAILSVSGDLDQSPGGPHPFPEPKSWGFTQHNPFVAVYETDRRSIYLMTQRIKRHPFLALFDGTDPNTSTPDRHTTIVPTQALFFMNDPFVHAKSTHLATRLMSCSDDDRRLDFVWRLMFGRNATASEKAAAAHFLAGYQADLNDIPADQRSEKAWAAWVRVLMSSNEFLFVD